MKMLILVDYNNLAHRCVHLRQIAGTQSEDSWSLLSYMVFNHIYSFVIETAEFLDEGDTIDVVQERPMFQPCSRNIAGPQ